LWRKKSAHDLPACLPSYPFFIHGIPLIIFGIISIGFVFTILATQKEVSIFAFFVLGGDGTMKPRANFAVAGFPESRSNNPFYINNLYYQQCVHYTVIASPISATKIGNLSFKI
jgi:hypothetical protein